MYGLEVRLQIHLGLQPLESAPWSLCRMKCLARVAKPCLVVQVCSNIVECPQATCGDGAMCNYIIWNSKEEQILHGRTGKVATWLEFERLSWRMNLDCSVRQSRDVRRKVGNFQGANHLGKSWTCHSAGAAQRCGRSRRAWVAENKADLSQYVVAHTLSWCTQWGSTRNKAIMGVCAWFCGITAFWFSSCPSCYVGLEVMSHLIKDTQTLS